MTREVQKKTLDDSLQFTDDFDEGMLDILEKKHLEPESAPEMSDQTDALPSLDDIPDDIPSLEPDEVAEEGKADLPNDEETGASPTESTSFLKRMTRNKAVLIGSALVLAALIASISWIYFRGHRSTTGGLTTMIRRSITVPHHQQGLTFFLYVDTGQRKDVFELSMELDFYGGSEPAVLQGNGILLRDTIYQFLRSQKPPESSYKYWEQIVQKELPVCLKTTFPKNCLQSIRLTHFGRL
jgi:hypothetical protein